MIEVDSLVKSYGGGGAPVLKGVSFTAETGKIVTLLGASGCGKSTTLRCVAGLETPDSGVIRLGDRAVYDSANRVRVPPERRQIGMVFQSYAIWPHMTVGENVAYPLRNRKRNRKEVDQLVRRALGLVGLEGLAGRLAPNLSGGQQQRVALARAIVAEPDVMLLDEPLSNLDAKLRDEMRGELHSLQRRLGFTMCFVTHDQSEALALSDLLILMQGGVIVEAGTPLQLYESPSHPFTAKFLGASNLVPSTVAGRPSEKEVLLENEFGRFVAGDRRDRPSDAPELFFRRSAVRPADPSEAGEPNVARMTVTQALFLGDGWQVEGRSGTHSIVVTLGTAEGRDLRPGEETFVRIGPALAFSTTDVDDAPAGSGNTTSPAGSPAVSEIQR